MLRLLGRLARPRSARRLHIGSGSVRLEGWLNVDIQRLPGVDFVADVSQGLHFKDVEAIFAEHFLEHLALDDGLRFLLRAQRVLVEGGWIRLSTPNLDWVWATHYHLGLEGEEKLDAGLRLNRAFHGWRHRFLWSRELLEETLLACGFEQVRWCRYGESDLPFFQGLERHEEYADSPDLPHVLVVEAAKGAKESKGVEERYRSLTERFQREFLSHQAD